MSAKTEHLIRMANDIAANVRTGKSQAEAAEAIASHLQRFWAPRMRARFLELCADNPAEIAPDVRLAAKLLCEQRRG